MRRILQNQLPLVAPLFSHSHLVELEVMSAIIDSHPEFIESVHDDLCEGVNSEKGAEALSAEQVFRLAILKEQNQFSYSEFEFQLCYHAAFRWFCRLPIDEIVTRSTLQRDISRISAKTWEDINTKVIGHAIAAELESGKKTRTDCTVTETNIHHPTDSSLLLDGVRVLTRLCGKVKGLVPSFSFSDHEKRAKRRAMGILNANRQAQRIPLYRDLCKVTQKTVGYAQTALDLLSQHSDPIVLALRAPLKEFLEHTKKVLDQTKRRVFEGESVAANEKLVSIFETHTDIIRKDRRDTYYGHKVCLTAGTTGLILDVDVLDGNPCDSTLAKPMMERVIQKLGTVPETSTFDGGFASRDNVTELKKLTIKNVVFSKKCGLQLEDMLEDVSLYQSLRNFRAGVEGIISFLKRCFGLRRCKDKGETGFQKYVQRTTLAANFLMVARLAIAQA